MTLEWLAKECDTRNATVHFYIQNNLYVVTVITIHGTGMATHKNLEDAITNAFLEEDRQLRMKCGVEVDTRLQLEKN